MKVSSMERAWRIQEYRWTILTYLGSDTGRTLPDGSKVIAFEEDGFYFTNDRLNPCGYLGIAYGQWIVVNAIGKIISQGGKWEAELERWYYKALKERESRSLAFHWNYYLPDEELSANDETEIRLAWEAIETEANDRRMAMIPDLTERLERRGKYLSLKEIVAKINKIFERDESNPWDLPSDQGSISVSGTILVKESYSGVEIYYDRDGNAWENGKLVFRCNYLYDEIRFAARDEYTIGLIKISDYTPYATVLHEGDWELEFQKL